MSTSTIDVRSTFLDAAEVAADLLASPPVEQAWHAPSVLRDWSVGGLAAHLGMRGIVCVEEYLDASERPAGDPVGVDGYYTELLGDEDLDSELHRGIRERGETAARRGPRVVTTEVRATLRRLRSRLLAESPARLIQVYGGFVLTLDDFLVTRLIEITLHVDDLSASAGAVAPRLDRRATSLAIGGLVDVARLRHGDASVLRALGRRERDDVDALHVL